MHPIKKILIVRLSSIGDIILSTPLIRCIKKKYPDSEIDFLIKKEFSDLMRNNPYISNLIEFDKKGGLNNLRKLAINFKDQKYDLFIDIHNNLRSNFLKCSIHSKYKSGYSKRLFKRSILVNTGWNLYQKIKPVYLRYFEAVGKFGIEYDGSGTEVFVPEEKSIKIKEDLYFNNYKSNQKLIVICPGASFTNKCWIPENFIIVADYFAKKDDIIVVFAGGNQDKDLCSKIQEGMQYKSVNFAGQFSLIESAALLKEAALVITNDSGLLHLTQSVKRPVVAIFGPTTRELGFYPLPENSKVIEQEVSCKPCTSRGLNYCPKKHFKCMLETSPTQVIHAAESLLEG